MASRFGILVAVLAFFTAGAAAGQPRLAAPDEVVIYLHPSLKDTDFAEGLVCELGRVLVAPVRTTTIDLPITSEHLATRTQLDVDKVARLFAQNTGSDGGRTFRYLILPSDLKAQGLNYVFAQTYAGEYRVSVVSVARLRPDERGLSRKRISDVTGERLYKLMLKSVAFLSGLRTNGCVMSFPRSLPELDAKAAEYCPEDRAALVDAGVLKARPFGACNTVAMVGR